MRIGRAIAVLAVFVVATVLLLGVVHPTTTSPSTSPAPAATTTTTTRATTTTTRPSHQTTTTTTTPPGKVQVLVANASGVTGAAAKVSSELQPAGWDLLPPTDATADVTSSHVYYVAGQQPAAESIAGTLHLTPSAVLPYTTAAPITSIGTADVLVVVGPDIAHASATTTTTVG
ncbi:MAG: LytR C-terminal domain-containing protein [Acidimicrobiales bacterium]